MATEANLDREVARIMKIGKFNFERVNNFTHLEVKWSSRGIIRKEINCRTLQENRLCTFRMI